MRKYYLKYDSNKGKFFIDVYESIKRTEKDLKEYAEAVERLAESGSELVFDTRDFDFIESYEYEGDIFSLQDVVNVPYSTMVIDKIVNDNNNSFRIPQNVNVYMDGNYAKLKISKPAVKTINVSVELLEDVLEYFHPTIDGRYEDEQEKILEKIKRLVK